MVLRAGAVEVAVEMLARPLRPGRIDFSAIEARALFRIAQEIVSRRRRP